MKGVHGNQCMVHAGMFAAGVGANCCEGAFLFAVRMQPQQLQPFLHVPWLQSGRCAMFANVDSLGLVCMTEFRCKCSCIVCCFSRLFLHFPLPSSRAMFPSCLHAVSVSLTVMCW